MTAFYVQLTPVGRGAVASIGVVGSNAAALISESFHSRGPAAKPIRFGAWKYEDGSREDLVVVRHDPERWEIQCHGGIQAARRITEGLRSRGAVEGDFAQWLDAGGLAPSKARLQLLLPQVKSRRMLSLLAGQADGRVGRVFSAIARDLDDGAVDKARDALARLQASWWIGRHLTQPFRVAIVGRPNAGKSSLMNRLAGFQRAIVLDQPGTTRDGLKFDTVLDGWPIEFVDTAGLRETGDRVEALGVLVAESYLAEADLVLWVADATAPWEQVGWQEPQGSYLFVHNKSDLLADEPAARPQGVLISCESGAGVETLCAEIISELVGDDCAATEPLVFDTVLLSEVTAAQALLEEDPRACCTELRRLAEVYA